MALGALDVARAVVLKGGPDAHEFLELLFPFLRRELRLKVVHIRGGDDTTKMNEITAQRDDVLRLRLLVLDGGEQKSGDGNSRSMGLGCNTIPAKPQQPVEATYGLARTAGFGSIVTLDFLQELSAQLTCSGRMERQLHRVRQDLNLDASWPEFRSWPGNLLDWMNLKSTSPNSLTEVVRRKWRTPEQCTTGEREALF